MSQNTSHNDRQQENEGGGMESMAERVSRMRETCEARLNESTDFSNRANAEI